MNRKPQPRRSNRTPSTVLVATAMLVLASCGGAAGVATTRPATTITTTTVAPAPTTTVAPAPTTTVAPAPTTAPGCTGGSTTIPTGAASNQVVDVDGDGRPDTAWILTDTSGVVTVGVVTSAGGGTDRTWNSASPVMRSVLVVDINDTTPPLFLADDGRTVQLWAFTDCTIADVLNVQGGPYEFSLGFTDVGTGVGCATVDGVHELVGLNVTGESADTVSWSSTVVVVSGTEARNGTVTTGTFASPEDDAAIALLHTVACDGQTIGTDGLTAPQ